MQRPYSTADVRSMQGRAPLVVSTLTSRLLQKLAISSAEVTSATVRLQNDSNASFSDLWNSELLLKLSVTYCAHADTCRTVG